MKTGFTLAVATILTLLTAGPGVAADTDAPADDLFVSAEGRELSQFRWEKRPLIVFADSPSDPRFIQQMDLLENRPDVLRDMDVVVIIDTDPAARSDIRAELRARDFAVILLSKEGAVVQRKPTPLDVRDLSRSIAKLPLRQQEIRDRR